MASSQAEIVKQGQVWAGKSCELVLEETKLYLRDEVGKEWALEDVIGVKVLASSPKGKPTACRAEICTYARTRSGRLKKKEVRKLCMEEIHFMDKQTLEDNQQTAQEWRAAVQLQCLKNDRRVFVSPENCDAMPLRPHRVAVIINPFSGTKKSELKFHKLVQPMFEIAGIEIVQTLLTGLCPGSKTLQDLASPYEMGVSTNQHPLYIKRTAERIGHATEWLRECDLSLIDAIVTASGDGIIYEVANGLFSRPDWETAIKIPVCPLPTGSGNGMVASQLYELNEEYGVCNAAFQLIRGGVQKIDAATIRYGSKVGHMILMFSLGLVADADIESETFRVLGGEIRSVLGALKAIAQRRLYQGKLSYLPMEGEEGQPIEDQGQPLEEEGRSLEEGGRSLEEGGRSLEEGGPANTVPEQSPANGDVTDDVTEATETGDVTEASEASDDVTNGEVAGDVTEASNDVTDATNGEVTSDVTEALDDVTEPTVDVTNATGDVTNATGDVTEPTGDVTNGTGDVTNDTGDATNDTGNATNATGDVTNDVTEPTGDVNAPIHGPKLCHLPPSLSSPVPSNWRTVEGSFIHLVAMLTSCMGHGFIGHPDIRLGCGSIMLQYCLDDAKRKKILKMLVSADDGSQVKMDHVRNIRAKAFRIEPTAEQGIMTVDGEVITYGPCDCEIHPNLFHICSRKRRDSTNR